jgi:hypothetical protein
MSEVSASGFLACDTAMHSAPTGFPVVRGVATFLRERARGAGGHVCEEMAL